MSNIASMALDSPTEWGPRFWRERYGYGDFESFFEDAGPLLEGFGFGPVRLPTELLARNSYYQPGSGLGTYVAGRLLADPDGLQIVSTAPWRSAADAAYTTQQENTMPTLIIPNAFQVSIEMEASSQPVVNVVGVTSSSGTAAGAAAAVKSAWEGTGKPLQQLAAAVQVRNYRAVDLGDAFGDIADLASTAVGGNVATGGLATMASSALVNWNGSSRSRSTRGRMYYGPLLDAQINTDGRTVASNAVTALNSAFATFISTLASAGYPLAVLSRKNSVAYPVSSAAVSAIIATQRRRLR